MTQMVDRFCRVLAFLVLAGAVLVPIKAASAQSGPATSPGATPTTSPRATSPSSVPAAGSQPALAPAFTPKVLKTSDGQERRYAVFVPASYAPTKDWPVVVFLNGSGENGTDGVSQTHVGLGPFLVKHRDKVPFIAVFPQGRTWVRGGEAKAVFEILAAVQRDYRTDVNRVYLTGLSMGGFGTWELAMMRPDLFAAIVPICGGGPVEYVANLRAMPIWAFHGAKDDRVPVELTRKLIRGLEKLGAKPKYTEFPTLGHFCWDQAYETKGLFGWLLAQRRPNPPQAIAFSFEVASTPIPTQIWWLRIDGVEPVVPAPQLQAAIASPSEVRVATRGITAFSLVLGSLVDDENAVVRVVWQGREAYRGKVGKEIRIAADPAATTQATTTPAPAPANGTATTKP